MQQLMGLSAGFGIRANPWLMTSVLITIKRQTVHCVVNVGDVIRLVTWFGTALSLFGFCRVVMMLSLQLRWSARHRVVV